MIQMIMTSFLATATVQIDMAYPCLYVKIFEETYLFKLECLY
jgi:hypothetical protein